ncbi:hypothetical protein [Ideonella sp. A 288]|uniref:hypothetical protein n=1 Tax=Ideonella sp. A 288 TaxID=1962181 RepID=UPI000B4AA6E0|nr:hypothetical protein [Ideonella sp. A 288]
MIDTPRPGPSPRRLRTPRRWLAAALSTLALMGPGTAAPARGADSGPCDLQWQVTPRLDASPRHLAVTLSFDTGSRTRTELRLSTPAVGATDTPASPEPSIDLETEDPQHHLETPPGPPGVRVVRHRPGTRVVLRYRVVSPLADADTASPDDPTQPLFGARWFQVDGLALLPVMPVLPETADRASPRLCLDFDGLPEDSWWIGSHGARQGAAARWRVVGPVALLRDAVYLGGALQVRERQAAGRSVWTAMPLQVPWAVPIDTVADRVARVAEVPRQFWRDTTQPHQLVVLQPSRRPTGTVGGMALHQALVLQVPDDFALPSDAMDRLVMRAQLRAWFPDRFGPTAYAGRHDEAQRRWFTEGFADHYAHRLLVHAGLWTLDDLARVTNARVGRHAGVPPARSDRAGTGALHLNDASTLEASALRGEWLALRWHAALRAQGHPGLDAVMAQMMLPAALAQREGPLSKPLVTHRLLAALRPWLGETPLRDLSTHIDQGRPLDFGDSTLGPCFAFDPAGPARYRARPDALAQAPCKAWMGIGLDAGEALAAVGRPGHLATLAAAGDDAAAPRAITSKARKGAKATRSGPSGKTAKATKSTKASKAKAAGGASKAKAAKGPKTRPKPAALRTAR